MSYSPENIKKPHVTTISGIGVGKTETTKMLGRERNFATIYEPWEKNAYLKGSYEDDGDKRIIQFTKALSQISFSVHRTLIYAYELEEAMRSPENDGIAEDSYIEQDGKYEETLFEMGDIDEDAHNLYLDLKKLTKKHTPKPDLVLHLTASFEVMIDRIFEERRREFELGGKEKYFKLVYNSMADLAKEMARDGIPVMTVNTDVINLVDNEKHIQIFLKEFDNKLVELGFLQFEDYASYRAEKEKALKLNK